jgi:hypothetical protein
METPTVIEMNKRRKAKIAEYCRIEVGYALDLFKARYAYERVLVAKTVTIDSSYLLTTVMTAEESMYAVKMVVIEFLKGKGWTEEAIKIDVLSVKNRVVTLQATLTYPEEPEPRKKLELGLPA